MIRWTIHKRILFSKTVLKSSQIDSKQTMKFRTRWHLSLVTGAQHKQSMEKEYVFLLTQVYLLNGNSLKNLFDSILEVLNSINFEEIQLIVRGV